MSDELDEKTQAWVDAKPPEYDAPDNITPERLEALERIAREQEEKGRGAAPPSLLSSLPPVGVREPVWGDLWERMGEMPERSGEAPPAAVDSESAPAAPVLAPPPPPPPVPSATGAAGALFDADEHKTQPHPFAPDTYGRCETCGRLSDGRDTTHTPGLADKFLVPPFSILDTRQDYWQKRRRVWLSLGMRGETTAEQSYAPQRGGAGKTASGVYAGHGNEALLKEEREQGLGRKQGMIYQHDAPGSDPSFYTRKTAVERELGRALTTEEFRRDWYDREEAVAGQSQSVQTGTSIFDPVLCEIAYRWWCPPAGRVLDPFAGGVVRGLIAGALGFAYTGTELRPEQIADNREQADALFVPGGVGGSNPVKPTWIEHDATRLGELDLEPADLVFTCPPYADLEVYSSDPRDISTMPYAEFIAAIGAVMEQTYARLKPDRFAVWVVGEARSGAAGSPEYGFVPDTVKAAQAAGFRLYNSAILVNSVGSAALRAQLIFRTRKVTRVHQTMFVFLKGDAKRAAAACAGE